MENDFNVINEDEIQQLLNNFNKSNKFKPSVSVIPTQAPKTYDEQIVVYKNGATTALYVYIDDTWVNVSGGSSDKITVRTQRTSTDGTGDAAISLGFEPSMVTIIALGTDLNDSRSDGYWNSSNSDQQCIEHYHTGSGWDYDNDTTKIISISNSGDTLDVTASITATNSDGFTLNWGKYELSSSVRCIITAYK